MVNDPTNLFSTSPELLQEVSSFQRSINAQMLSIYTKFPCFSSELALMYEEDCAYRAYDC